MDIVDAQVHLFMTMDDEAAVHAMDALGIRGAVIDEAWDFGEEGPHHSSMPAYKLATGEWRPISPGGVRAAMHRPDRFSYLLRINPDDPGMAFVMAEAAATPGCRAFRLDSRGEREDRAAESGERMDFFRTAETLGVPVFVMSYGKARNFEPYLRACPSLPLIFDHCGLSLKSRDFDDLLRLAEYPNAHLKWCHAPIVFQAKEYPFPEVRPQLNRALEAFGRERIMWGSDFTAVPLASQVLKGPNYSWAEALFYMRANPDLSESDLEWLLGRSVRKVLNWPASA